jgi:hypothetical protein
VGENDVHGPVRRHGQQSDRDQIEKEISIEPFALHKGRELLEVASKVRRIRQATPAEARDAETEEGAQSIELRFEGLPSTQRHTGQPTAIPKIAHPKRL